MEHKSSKNNLFENADKQLWINKIKEELRLDDFNSLVNNAGQKIYIDPFYTKEDLARTKTSFFDKKISNWQIVFKINFSDVETIKKEIEKSKKFNIGHIEISAKTSQNLSSILKEDILPDSTFISIDTDSSDIDLKAITNLNKFYLLSPTAYISNKEYFLSETARILTQTTGNQILGIKEPDEDLVEELAYSLSRAVEYFDTLTEKGINKELILENIHFHTSIGDNFIIEIAKLRAFRSLWDKLKELLSPGNHTRSSFHAEPIPTTSSINNENDEIIALTVKSTAAILGNSDFIKINSQSFSEVKQAEEFYQRMRINLLHILREESFLDKVTDPLAGSYLIETLTSRIAEAVWEKFQEIESSGGYSQARLKKIR